MLRKSLLLVSTCLLASTASFAQRVKRKGVTPIDVSKNKRNPQEPTPVFTTDQFVGKWQEIKRSYKGQADLRYSDTIYLNFMSNNKVITRSGMQSNMEGEVAIESPGNVLLAAADVYTILSVNDSIAVLDNQEDMVHTFKKTNQFIFENYGKTPVAQNEYKTPVSVSLSQLLGKWSVYKKVAKPGAINPPTNIVAYLKIAQKTGESTASGEISFYQTDQTKQTACTIKITGSVLSVTAGKDNWLFNIYKVDAKEFVFGDPEVMLYFAKPL